MWAILSDDLIDCSKVIADARQRGESARQCRTLEQLEKMLSSPDLKRVVLDLHHPQLNIESLMSLIRNSTNPIHVIAYGSHVDAARLKAARAAGCDEVMPRSRFLKG